MKKAFFLLICLLMLLGVALGEQAEPALTAMPKEQIGLITPNGLVFEKTLVNGSLSLEINDDTTNWARAIAQCGSAEYGEVLVQFKVPRDKVNEGDYLIFFTAETDEDAYEIIKASVQYNGYKHIEQIDNYGVACRMGGMPLSENAVKIARAIPEMSYLNPLEKKTNIYVGWYRDNSGVKELIENTYYKLAVDVQHNHSAAFKTTVFNGVPEARIRANYGNNSSITVLSAKDGMVNYCIPSKDMQAQTGVLAPENADSYALSFNMKAGAPMEKNDLTEDRYVVLNTFRGQFDTNAVRQTIYFYNDDELVEEVSLTIGYQSAENLLPWPAYNARMTVVNEDRLKIVNHAKQAGYSVDYDDKTGHVQGSYTGEIGSSAAENTIELRVEAPEDAVYCRVYVGGGNQVMGPGAGSEAGLEYDLSRYYPTGPESIQSGYVHVEKSSVFEVIEPGDSPITIFVPPSSATIPNFAELYVFEWYNDWGDPINVGNNATKEYLWKTVENFAVAERTIPVKQQKDLTGPVTQPEIVVPNGNPYQNYQLKLTSYYTEGSNAWFYDLTMLDGDGNAAKPNTPVWVYLPYPEEHETGKKYKLNHYSNGLYDGSDTSSEAMLLQETLYGLMFETTSFSPFILSGEEEAPAAEEIALKTVMLLLLP